MKIVIDLTKLSKKKLTVNQYLLLLKIYHRAKNKEIDFEENRGDYLFLRDGGFLTIDGTIVQLCEKAVNLVEGRGERDYEDLATKIRESFPKGMKSGKYPWRTSVRELVTRLKKLDKNHGMTEYTDNVIINAVENYVNKFTVKDMDAGMQTCKYFIEKDGSSTLIDLLSTYEDEKPIFGQSNNLTIRL